MSKALKELEEYGVAVVPEVMTEDECDEQITLIHQWLAKFHPNFPSNINSIIHKYKIGHCETAWACRMKAKSVFSEIYGTDKLLASFDGLAMAPPPENGDARFKFVSNGASYDGLHLDQGPRRLGFHAYQGALYMEEAATNDYCFKVIKNSHKYHTEFFDNYKPNPRSEFRKLKEKEVDWYLGHVGCSIERIAVPKGGMVLWDSRTVHAGAPPIRNRENARWRYVSFVCMAPAKWADFIDLAEKKRGYETMRTSNHWPANGAHLFKDYAPVKNKDFLEQPDIAKTDEAKRLSGVLPYEQFPEDLPKWKPLIDNTYDYLEY